MTIATLGGETAWGELEARAINKGQVGDVIIFEGELSVEKPDKINALFFSRQPIKYKGPAEVNGEVINIEVEVSIRPNPDGNSFCVRSSGDPILFQ